MVVAVVVAVVVVVVVVVAVVDVVVVVVAVVAQGEVCAPQVFYFSRLARPGGAVCGGDSTASAALR